MISVKRYLLGVEYQKIAKELATYDMIPRFVWTREQKERVVELLEREAEMDIELAVSYVGATWVTRNVELMIFGYQMGTGNGVRNNFISYSRKEVNLCITKM